MYKTFWFNLHWFLGAVFGVLLLIVGLSGAILSYEKEIMNLINKDTYYVEVPQNQERLALSKVVEIYQEQYPDSKINSIGFFSDLSSSIYFNIAKEGFKRGENIYLNPYTAEVLPQVAGKDFFMFVFRLHRWLAFEGSMQVVGKQAVALATIAAIILTISGIVVYWSRIKKGVLKSFTFSFRQKNRAFLSTMHSALGLWVVPFFLLMCLTGLYWSYDWYRGVMFSVLGVEQPKRAAPSVVQNQKIVFDDIEETIKIFENSVEKEYKNATLRVNPSKNGTFTITYLFADSTHYRETNSMEIDVQKQEVVKQMKYQDKKLNEKIASSILPLHSGEFFGWFGKMAYFISSALMALFVITGYMLYFDRWKKKNKNLKINKEKT